MSLKSSRQEFDLQCFACGNKVSSPKNDFCAECLQDEGLKLLYPQEGLSPQEYSRSFNMIKGRIAETLIEELFLRIGFSVYRCGMENTLPGVMKHLVKDNGSIANHIRKMPDFVVRDPQRGQLFFIEVKFRADGCFDVNDLATNYPYDDAYIVVVSKRHIKCLTARELKHGASITQSTQNYLGSRREFSEYRDVIIDYCHFAALFFANV